MYKRLLSLLLVVFSFAHFGTAQVYQVNYTFTQIEDSVVVDVYMGSAQNTDVDIKAINFSVAFDSSCHTVSSYTCHFSESWTKFAERGRTLIIENDSTQYGNVPCNKRWIFGTAQFPRTPDIVLPAKGKEPLKVLTITFGQTCKTPMLYLEDEAEFRVNQMGDKNLRPAAWIILRTE
ncbi:MAG: hypothetical protein AB8F95_07595 [Bacteroidia bacterium]